MKVYLLIIGEIIKGYLSLSVLCKENNLDKKYIKENLPIVVGRVSIKCIELNEKSF